MDSAARIYRRQVGTGERDMIYDTGVEDHSSGSSHSVLSEVSAFWRTCSIVGTSKINTADLVFRSLHTLLACQWCHL
jgi:hypothetical protein